MYNGTIKGMLAFGMNGVAIGPNSKKNIDALKKADFLVVGEIYPDETSEFWKSPGITTDEMKQIQNDCVLGCLAPGLLRRTVRSPIPRDGCYGRTRLCQRPEMPGWTRPS